MIDFILSSFDPVNKTSRKIGHFEKCLDEEDKELLIELQQFLKPFLQFTHLFSKDMFTFSLISLVSMTITDICLPDRADKDALRTLKLLTLQVGY